MTEKPDRVSRGSTTTMTVTTDISNMADTIDTRDIADRINELENTVEEADADALEELATLNGLMEAIGSEALDGVTLIRDSYFKEYAMELADEIGTYDRDLKWPLTCIDWGQAARELQYDYSAVDYDGVTYWFSN